jgi:hypothetical protein
MAWVCRISVVGELKKSADALMIKAQNFILTDI